MPATLIVIPHYGPDRLLLDLFRSVGLEIAGDSFRGRLTRLDQPGFTFLIVNNNTSNIGFTAACNEGLRRLLEPGWDFAWLLNNDTIFESHEQFERSLQVMQNLTQERGWAIVAQQVRSYERPDQIIFGGAWECFPSGRHKSGLRSRHDWAQPCEENWLNFCSVLVRADLVKRIGSMDEAFTNYFSDSDYSLEARKAGFKIGYAGEDSFLYHRVGQSANPGAAQQSVLQNDYLTFWNKWIGSSRYGEYLRLMKRSSTGSVDPRQEVLFTAGDLAHAAPNYPDLRSWLKTLPGDQLLEFKDILYRFQHQQPASRFSALCNIARELLEAN